MENLYSPDNEISVGSETEKTVSRVREGTIVATLAFVAFALPAIYALIFGLPVAHVQDELSYVLAGDTYASGRMTNPTPAFYESFETTHIIFEPSYISKYPPLQGIFLAIGQRLFGYQIVGVWLSCSLFAVSLYWLLGAWMERRWAIFGTGVMIVLLGIGTYWAQSFWGGMIAASGGALFFGGLRRIIDDLTVGATLGFVIGGIILVNSRPFEGTVTMIPGLIYLLVWFIRNRDHSFAIKFRRLILPGFAVAALALAAMGYQYYRVTGSPYVMPYSVHHAQYYPAPLFSFQEYNRAATRGNPRIRRVYDSYTHPPILEALFSFGLPDSTLLRSVYGFLYQFLTLPYFLFSPVFLALFFAVLPSVLRSDRWLWFIGANIVFTFAVVAVGVWWDQHHYLAPIAGPLFLLLVIGIRKYLDAAKTTASRRLALGAIILLVLLSGGFGAFFGFPIYRFDHKHDAEIAELQKSIETGAPVTMEIPVRATFFKAEFERIVDILPDRYIAIVGYSGSSSFHDEIVFNRANIEAAKMVWAHDLGPERNNAMLAHYNGRRIVDVFVDGSQISVTPRY